MERWIGLLGLLVMLFLAWLLSSHRQRFPWRVVAGGLGLQWCLAFLVLKTGPGRSLFEAATEGFNGLRGFVEQASMFLFGVRQLPDEVPLPSGFLVNSFAFGVLPTIVVFSSLMAILYHLGVMQWVVQAMAWLMQRTLGTSGPETVAAAANIFVGQTEAPLVVRPYLPGMTRSELFALMTGGFATVTGSLLVAYVQMGADAGHLLTACVISAPAALMVAKIMEPEVDAAGGEVVTRLRLPRSSPNLIGAAASGASDGLKLALNVAAMLLAFLALIAMLDWGIGRLGMLVGQVDPQTGLPIWSLAGGLGYLFWPLAWLLGVPAADCWQAGQMLGIKMAANEFLAFDRLQTLLQAETPVISERTRTLMTYALAGFANFSSIAIQLGGIGALVPERRDELARLGLRAMLGGTLACNCTACVAGLLLD
jgi:concentrative nucleoside transporter, CNT family